MVSLFPALINTPHTPKIKKKQIKKKKRALGREARSLGSSLGRPLPSSTMRAGSLGTRECQEGGSSSPIPHLALDPRAPRSFHLVEFPPGSSGKGSRICSEPGKKHSRRESLLPPPGSQRAMEGISQSQPVGLEGMFVCTSINIFPRKATGQYWLTKPVT